MKRKLIALLLVVVIVMALVPTAALAHEGTYDEHNHKNDLQCIRVRIQSGAHGDIYSPRWQVDPWQGENWTFTAIPDSGYKFSHWTYRGNEASGAFFTSGANGEVLHVIISQKGVPGYIETPSLRPSTWYWVDPDYMKYKAQAVFIPDPTELDVTLDLGSGGTFDSNGQSTIVVSGRKLDSFSVPAFTENPGYDHIGWTETPDFSSSRTIGSRYEYEVTFAGNSEITITGGSPAWTVNHNVSEPSYTVAPGFRFDGWDRSLNGITAPTTINANPAVGRGTISVNSTGEGSLARAWYVNGTYDFGTSIRLNDAWPATIPSSRHIGWRDNNTGQMLTPDVTITVSGDCTYTAVFGEWLDTSAGSNGSLTTDIDGWYEDGTNANLNDCVPQADPGFEFDKWIENDFFGHYQRDVALVGGEPIIAIGDSNYFEALFKVAEYTVTFVDSQGDTLGTETVLHGGDVTKTAGNFTYDAGERPIGSGWNAAEGQNITTDKTIVVNTEYEVTFDLDGGTKTGGGELVQWIAYDGDALAPDVDAPSGKYFTGWNKALTGIKLSQTITAEFADKTEIILTANSDTVTYDGTVQTVSGFTGLPSGLTIEGVSASGSGTNVGTYDVTFTTGDVLIYDGAEDVTERYTISYVDGTLTINKADMTVSATGYSATYDGLAHDGVTNVTPSENDATITYSTDAATYSSTMPQFTNAGTYTVYVKASKANFNDATTSVTVQIDQADASITANNKSKTYGDADPAFDAVVAGEVNGETLDYSLSRASGENAGTYDIIVTLGGGAVNDNYNLTTNNGTLTITKADMTVSATGYSGTYDGAAHDGVTNVTLSENDATITYSTDGTTYSSTMPQFTNAGTYTVYLKASKANFNDATTSVTVQIDQADASITANNKSKTYGDADPAFDAVVTGEVNSETLDYSLSRAPGENAGTYNIIVTLGGGAVNNNYNITTNNGTLTITKADMTVSATGYSATYDGSAHDGVTSVTPSENDATITYSMDGTTYSSTMPQFTNAGTYTVYVKASKANFNDATTSVSVQIDQADATITANNKNKTYGDADPTFDAVVTGEVNSETLDYSLSRGPGENAGTYNIIVTLGGGAVNDNYNITTNNGTLTINKVDASITANDKSKTYGDADPALDATVTGTVNGETLDYSLSRDPGENAGAYNINVALGSDSVHDNYNITVNNGTLTINKADLTITANDKSKTYGDADPVLDATVTGTVNGETLDYSLVRVPGENVGTYEIIVILGSEPSDVFSLEVNEGILSSGSVNDNYNITTNNGTLTINEAELTVTADDKTITFLDAAPTYTVSYSGFVAGEDESVLGGTLQTDCSYTQGDAVGAYAIKASGLASGNYNITHVDGTLTVEQLILTVTFLDHDGTVLGTDSVVYGDPATAPADPTRGGYTFTGWDKAFDAVKADLDVTATYTINTFEVKFFDHDGTQIGTTQTVDWSTAATEPADPERLGHTFAGWDKAFDAVTANLDVTATYTINSYTVTFVDHDGTVLKTERVEWRDAATAPADPTRDGYEFTGWDKEFDRVVRYMTVTALYDELDDPQEPEEEGFLVQFFDDEGNLISEQRVEEGGAAKAPEPPVKEGYEFAGWDKDFDPITQDLVVTALYTKLDVPSTNIIEDEPSAEADLTDTTQGSFAWWWIVAGAGAIALLLLILFFVKRRKDQEEEA